MSACIYTNSLIITHGAYAVAIVRMSVLACSLLRDSVILVNTITNIICVFVQFECVMRQQQYNSNEIKDKQLAYTYLIV
jgi:hypothetical protein